jgi:predicted PurR-regulated permease PerM
MNASTAQRSRYGEILAATVVIGLALYVFGRTAGLFLILFISALLALFLSVIADFVVRRTRVPRWLALIGAVLLTVSLTIGIFLMVAPPVAEQLRGLVQSLPTTVERLETVLDALVSRVPALANAYPPGEHRILIAFTDQLSNMLRAGASRIFFAAPDLFAIASTLVMAIYLAANPARYADAVVAYMPPRERAFARSVLSDIVASMRGWLVGQLINMTILGALMAIGLKIIGVPYWLAFGVLTFVAALVPFFGSLASTVLPALVVLGSDGSPGKVIAVLLLGLFVQLFEGNVLAPLVMAVEVDLAPVVTMFGILIMGALAGPIGVVVAVPVIATLDVLSRRILIERIYRSERFREPLPPPVPPAAPST